MDAPCRNALSAWVFWLQATKRPDANQMVTDIRGATSDLGRILHQGIPEDDMQRWLQRWPTEKGMERYRRLCGWGKPNHGDDSE